MSDAAHQQNDGSKYALLVGINRYGGREELKGCVNDANDVKRMLVQRGWKPRNVKVLLNEQATKPKVIEGLRWLASHRDPGANLWFHFSGHGDWTLSPEGWQVCICCTEYKRWGETATGVITNTEFNAEAQYAAGTRMFAMMDSCFSGGMAARCGPKKRLPAKVRQLLYGQLTSEQRALLQHARMRMPGRQ